MIQKETFLKIVDNSGGNLASCIAIKTKSKYAILGSIILVSIKRLRSQRRSASKIKKGEIHKALIVQTKKTTVYKNNNTKSFSQNSIIILNKNNKTVATRIFVALDQSFRKSKFLKLLFISVGVLT